MEIFSIIISVLWYCVKKIYNLLNGLKPAETGRNGRGLTRSNRPVLAISPHLAFFPGAAGALF